jgi:hypothetical protein
MIVTKKDVVEMLLKYINRKIDLLILVNWAEEAIKEADFEAENFELIRDIVSRIGLSDVREFGLTWDACYDHLRRLGYDVKVELLEAKQ